MKARQRREFGTNLVLLSFLVWFALPLIPALGLSVSSTAWLAATAFLLMEALFWGGVALAGRQAVNQWKNKVLSFFRPRPADIVECSTGRLC